MTAVVVLVLGAAVLLATAYAIAVGSWENDVGKVVVLLLVVVGMWRAASHLRRRPSAG